MTKQSKSTKRASVAKKLRVLLIDDEKKYLSDLKRAHPECHFDYSSSIDDVCGELEKRRAADKWPDILLLDVYWPKTGSEEIAETARDETHRILRAEVEPAIDRMNAVYLSAFQKWGTRALAQIRKQFTAKELPVIMYSSKGHFLLRDQSQDWLSEAVEYGANWLCKGTVSVHAEKLIFRSMAAKGSSVFIGHGRSAAWRKLARFVGKKLNLSWEEFNRISAVGIATKERLEEMLDESAIGILVATAEDQLKEGLVRARENVVHEIGLCQGRLGFERAVVLLEEGCNEFSNIHGITQIRFPKGRLEAAFPEVVRVLKREGLLPNRFRLR